MNIPVEYLDPYGNIHNRNYQLTRLAFAKHLAMAGQGYILNPNKLIQAIALMIQYSAYMQRRPFYRDNRFSEPPPLFTDPTQKAQFSNLAGKAIADFLSKQIDNSLMTLGYEGLMRVKGHQISGPRPDLIAFTPNYTIAMEAKGKTSPYPGNMANHKAQAQSGPFTTNYSVACVSYNLYDGVQCKYHDPENDGAEYDIEALSTLSKDYFGGLAEFLNENSFEVRRTEIQNEKFFEVNLSRKTIKKLFDDVLFFDRFGPPHFHFDQIQLLLPGNIIQYAEQGLSLKVKPFKLEYSELNQRYLYIDNDRVGLRLW